MYKDVDISKRPWVFPGPLFCGPEEKTFSNKKEVPMSPEKIPTRIRTTLAQKLRFLRFTRGWSQEVLAELAGSWLPRH